MVSKRPRKTAISRRALRALGNTVVVGAISMLVQERRRRTKLTLRDVDDYFGYGSLPTPPVEPVILATDPTQATPTHVLGYETYAHTHFFPSAGSFIETETDAYRLAREGLGGQRSDYDDLVWGLHGLANPGQSQKYRDQVQLGRVLVRGLACSSSSFIPMQSCGALILSPWTRRWPLPEDTWRVIRTSSQILTHFDSRH